MRSIIKKTCMIMTVLVLGAAVHAELLLYESWEGKTTVDNQACIGVLGGWADTDSDGTGNIVIDTDGDGTNLTDFVDVECHSGGDERGVAVFGVSDPIADGEQGLVFFRFRLLSASRRCYSWFGIHHHNFTSETGDAIGTGNENDVMNVMSVGFLCYRDATSGPISLRRLVAGDNNHGGAEITTITAGLWYDCWFDINNADDTFDLYIQPSTSPGGAPPAAGPTSEVLLDDEPFHFTPENGGLYGVVMHAPDDDGTDPRPWADRSLRTYVDDIYWDGSQGLVSLGVSTPDPANGAENIDLDKVLSWEAPGSPEVFEIIGYDVYVDPNQTKVSSRNPDVLRSAGQLGTGFDPILNVFEEDYYWAVDVTITLTSDPNTPKTPVEIPGRVWTFKTTDPGPEVTADPVDVLVDIGDDVLFTVSVYSPYATESYQWLKSGAVMSGQTSPTLSLTNVQISDEAFYSCRVSNEYDRGNGIETFTVESAPAALGIKRKVAHWTLDQADYVGGQYLDSSGEGHHADPNTPVIPVDGQNPAGTINPAGISYQGVTVDSEGGWAHAGTWDPSGYSEQLTVSLWVKWNGQPATPVYHGLMGKRSIYSDSTPPIRPTDMRWQIEVQNNAASALRFGSNTGTTIVSPALPVGEWEQVVVTFDGTTGTIYRNGTYAASGAFSLGVGPTANLMIGAVGHDPELVEPTSILDGYLDDIQIYNYALDPMTIASRFAHTDGLGRKACFDPRDSILVAYDVDGDCQVGLGDLIELAANWLDGQLVPDVVARP